MTQISFYTHVQNRFQVVQRLVAKARAQKLNVLVYADRPQVADEIDRLLWTQPALSFVPHCRDDNPLATTTPVVIGTRADIMASADVMINLSDSTPEQFSRFERLMEIVTVDEPGVLAGRERYRFYRDRGYELATHDMSNQASTGE